MASPEMLAQFTDDARAMIDMLQDDTIKTIALLRMEGYSVEEIAERLECGKRTIERRLTLIRKTWSESEKPKDSIESQS
jgi:DNA-directed RNA polymerase specialized sigma24 family protein